MYISENLIEDEFIDFFNPFVYIAVLAGKSTGGFDIRNINGTHLKFIIFDKKWEDENKKSIWEESYDIRNFWDTLEIKSKIAPHIEKSIRIFCES
ncbi:MAG: hypothetical protein PHF86_01740 [Candidatus Nanoarchaeia archaeon]|nr:hypothetical protein [Candidatus Nanoarchaeia archaeon]